MKARVFIPVKLFIIISVFGFMFLIGTILAPLFEKVLGIYGQIIVWLVILIISSIIVVMKI